MNICIIDDHILIRQALKNLLTELDPKAYSTRIYKSAEDFLAENFAHWQPDLIIVDLGLPGMNGLEMITQSRKRLPLAKYLVLSAIVDLSLVQDLLRKGELNGYLTKDASEEELLEAIQAVMSGTHYVNRSLKDKLLEHLLSDEPVMFHLSPMEKEVLNRLCGGSTPKEISAQMSISIHTVQRYIKNLLLKFKTNRTTQLVLLAIQKGFYNPVQK